MIRRDSNFYSTALKHSIRIVLRREHLFRTLFISLIVGTWLTLFNQGEVIISGRWGPILIAKVFLNYLTPFVVANLGLISRKK